jgi:Domain of unknown function (DUF3883)
MSGVRRPEGVLARAGFLRTAELIRSGVTGREALIHALHASVHAPFVQARNTLDMLTEIGALGLVADGQYCWVEADSASDFFTQIRTSLAVAYGAFLDGLLPAHVFQLEPDGKTLRANAAQLPGRDRCYPYALLAFDIFRRERSTDSFWTVSEDMEGLFIGKLHAANANAHRHVFTLASLKHAQRLKEEAGRRSEMWVVQWERQRLTGHPFNSLVRSISDDDAAAGFDILSFDSTRHLVHDRFIEAKSYAEEHSFYWSCGEIESARVLGMRYWLYLVDRRQLDRPEYQPEMIQDPVSYFIDREPVGWEVSTPTLKFTRVD